LVQNSNLILRDWKLIDPVPIDVVNKHYKFLIGRSDGDNLQDSEYFDLEEYPEAIFQAWKEYYGDRSNGDRARTSLEDIVIALE
jgi:hypothetical protein